DVLIRDKRRLKRQLAALETKTIGRNAPGSGRAIGAIAKRVERALSSGTGSTRSRRSNSASSRGRQSSSAARARKPATVRKPASPKTQAKRLAALAKAREVRAAKKAAAT